MQTEPISSLCLLFQAHSLPLTHLFAGCSMTATCLAPGLLTAQSSDLSLSYQTLPQVYLTLSSCVGVELKPDIIQPSSWPVLWETGASAGDSTKHCHFLLHLNIRQGSHYLQQLSYPPPSMRFNSSVSCNKTSFSSAISSGSKVTSYL